MEEMQKPHVALLSSPGLGHLIPVIELANRFVIQHNFKATILSVTCQASEAESQVLKSAMTHNLCDIIDIPAPDISGLVEPNAAVVTQLNVMMRETIPAIRSALSNMTQLPSVLILDIFGGVALSITEEFKMHTYTYVASNARFLSLAIYSPVLDKQVEGQYVEQKEPLKIPGCTPVRPEDVVDPMLDRNSVQYREYLVQVNSMVKCDGVLVNTWEDLEHKELQALRDPDLLGRIMKVPVHGIGPMVRPAESAASQTTDSVLEWLHKQPSESVIYVSFGSGGTLSYEQITEVAWGLELSGHRFVWVVRSPSVASSDAAFFGTVDGRGECDYNDPLIYLPEGFKSRTQKVGILVSQWAPQVAILNHPSVGGFLSHCGWSSTLESITNGVPMIAWPLYAEQRMNATLLAEELGVAVRPKVLPAKKVVDREEIASMVRQIMEVDTDGKPNPIRERVKELKQSAFKAVSMGGSSYAALSEVAKQCEASWESRQISVTFCSNF